MESNLLIFIFKSQCSWMSRGYLWRISQSWCESGQRGWLPAMLHALSSITGPTGHLSSPGHQQQGSSLHPSPTQNPSLAQQPCAGPAAPNMLSQLQALSKPRARSSSRDSLFSSHSWDRAEGPDISWSPQECFHSFQNQRKIR